jgi:hypothetical protein
MSIEESAAAYFGSMQISLNLRRQKLCKPASASDGMFQLRDHALVVATPLPHMLTVRASPHGNADAGIWRVCCTCNM